VPLSSDQRQEAVGLLAELLLDAAVKCGGVFSGVVSAGALHGASDSVGPLPDEGVRARRAA
jgi:hypothetical protein